MTSLIIVRADFDPEAQVWYTHSSDVHGLRIEASSLEALVARIPGAIQDFLEGGEDEQADVPIEVIAHASTRLRIVERA